MQWVSNPLDLFESIYQQAVDKSLPEPNSMALATVDSQGQPSVRIVLYKGRWQEGITFYTNYEGRKAKDMAANSKVAATFFWPQLKQQIRFEGQVTRLPREQNEIYFKTRPRISQLGAWASNQSQIIPSLEDLLSQFKTIEKQYQQKEIPCPPNWGGYVLTPHEVEFWVSGEGRLHERYVYQKSPKGWTHFMRSP